jgi:hypothetical protein
MSRRLLTLLGVAVAVPLLATAQQRGAARPPVVPVPELPRDSAGNIVSNREVFTYVRGARRDPFVSLIASGDIRPLLADLEVGGIIFDPTGRNSTAMLKDVSTGELYRARVGSVFGRLRITAINARSVSIAIDEFGFTRQEELSINAPSRGGRTP